MRYLTSPHRKIAVAEKLGSRALRADAMDGRFPPLSARSKVDREWQQRVVSGRIGLSGFARLGWRALRDRSTLGDGRRLENQVDAPISAAPAHHSFSQAGLGGFR